MTKFRYSVFVLVVCYVVNIQKFMMPYSQSFHSFLIDIISVLTKTYFMIFLFNLSIYSMRSFTFPTLTILCLIFGGKSKMIGSKASQFVEGMTQ